MWVVSSLNDSTVLALSQTFQMVFAPYVNHPEYKSVAADGTFCKADSQGLLRRYPVTDSDLHLIGKETEPAGGSIVKTSVCC